MRTKVGTFRYPVEVGDAAGQRFEPTMPLVDTGALYSQLPAELLRSLGHRPNATRRFGLADGSTIERPVGPLPLKIDGEVQTVLCIFGQGSEQLLGAVTLETFSLAPDPVNETLVPVIAMLA